MSQAFDLPAPDASVAPAFGNPKECADWLEALPLTNSATAQTQLRAQFDVLARAAIKPAVLFEMLELMREPLYFVQVETAKKFVHRALPLADLEMAARNGSLGAWQAYRTAVLVCLQTLVDGARDLKSQAATVCHRALDAHVRMMIDAARTNAEAKPTEWEMLHRIYRAAEALEVAGEKVKDPLSAEAPVTHCMAVYSQVVLVTLGSYNEWTARQSQMILRWLARWSVKNAITKTMPETPVKLPVLTDTDSARGGFRLKDGSPLGEAPLTAGARYVDIGELSLSIKNRVIMLRKGETPVNLGLGEDCVMPGCEQQLINLYQHWCDGRVDRAQTRKPVSGNALAAVGLVAMHYYVGGKPFKQPGEVREMTAKQRQEIATFGRLASRDDEDFSQIHGFALEHWQLKDESIAGLRIGRIRGARGQRIAPGTLMAVRPDGAKHFMMGSVRWVQWLTDDSIAAGVRAIPGSPMAVALKQTGVNAAKEPWHQGLMMPAVESLKVADSVIVPAGWFKPGKVLEIHSDKPWRITLADVVERGAEFERCTYGGAV